MPGDKIFLLFQIKINIFLKYLQVLLKLSLPCDTDLNFNSSRTSTKFLFDNVHLYSSARPQIFFSTSKSDKASKWILVGFFDMEEQQTLFNIQAWKER